MGSNLATLLGRRLRGLTVVWLLLSLITPLGGLTVASATSGPSLTGSNSFSGTYGNAVAITDLQVSDTGNPTEQVRLTVSDGILAMATTTGLTFTGASSGAQLKFSGSLTNVNAALATLSYTRTSSVGSDTLEVSLVGANQVYDPDTGHLYEYVTSDGSKTWTQAKALADARTADGASGYLVTITSADENNFVSARLTGAGWMGASDAASEGVWKWVDGPENGTTFCNGDYTGPNSGCVPVGSNYANWNNGEPNNSGNNENCAQFLSGGSGEWNDLPCTGTTLAGYVVEYGAPGNLPNVASKNITLNVTGTTHNISSCTDLQTIGADTTTRFDTLNLTADIDCTGINFAPLYQTDGFYGTLNGHGHKITNLTINDLACDVGLFSTTHDATIENLTLASGSLVSYCNGGAVVGRAYGVTLDNVHSNININTNDDEIGGLVGELQSGNSDSLITDSSVDATVDGNYAVGGLVGYASQYDGFNLIIQRSYTAGTVNLTNNGTYGGGLIGITDVESSSTPATITLDNTYSQANVVGGTNTFYLGGLVGYIYQQNDSGSGHTTDTTITRSYASGQVTGDSDVGGLIGYLDGLNSNATATVSHTFAAGAVTAITASLAGGLVGFYNLNATPVTFTDNYYDQTGTNQATCAGSGGTSFTCTAEADSNYFKTNHANAPMSTWDFSNLWIVNPSSYPTFAASDDDGDGISSADENAGPNGGDANGDGIPDANESNVVSLPDPVDGHYVTLQTSCGSLVNVQVGAENTTSGQTDVAYTYPGGLLRFVVTGCPSGATAAITQYYYGLSNPSQFVMRKWDSGHNTYTTVPGAAFSMVTIGSQTALKAVYHITDGSALDQDGLTNGTIVDPVGPAMNVIGAPDTGLGGLSRP